MSKYCDSDALYSWLGRPLCLRYVAAVFRSVIVKAHAPEGSSRFVIHWGLGRLLSGEQEVLGVWTQAEGNPELPVEVLDELRTRGVLRLRALTGNGVRHVLRRLGQQPNSLVRGSDLVPFEGEALADAPELRSLPPSVSDAVLVGDRLAQVIHRGLTAALARRTDIANQEEAMAFVATWLHRADRRLWAPSGAIKATKAIRPQRNPAPTVSSEAHG